MAYRAHVRVIDEKTGKPFTMERIQRELPVKSFGRTGTRHGIPGLWVEKDRKGDFEARIAEIARYALNTGYQLEFAYTNLPSGQAMGNSVSFFRRHGASIDMKRG